MKLVQKAVFVMGGLLSGPIVSFTMIPQVQAASPKLRNAAPIAVPTLPNENPTCYIQLPGQARQTLDSICGTRDPKPDRRRSRHELDRDGVPFVMKENYRAVQEANRKAQEASQRFEREMPFSDHVLRLKAQQQQLSQQYMNAKTQRERDSLSQQMEANSRQMQADPSYQKAYEMMRKLYQGNR
jgi:hypothetical protein